jgi:uncharacterized protein
VRRVLVLPRRVAIGLVVLYQQTLGRALGGRCRFHPSCSEYAIEALRLNGLIFGVAQSAWRVVRCGPWSAGGVEHPKPIGARRPAHG